MKKLLVVLAFLPALAFAEVGLFRVVVPQEVKLGEEIRAVIYYVNYGKGPASVITSFRAYNTNNHRIEFEQFTEEFVLDRKWRFKFATLRVTGSPIGKKPLRFRFWTTIGSPDGVRQGKCCLPATLRVTN